MAVQVADRSRAPVTKPKSHESIDPEFIPDASQVPVNRPRGRECFA